MSESLRYIAVPTFNTHLGDCLNVMRAMHENSVDSIVTDPPYGLTTGKKGGSGPASLNLASPAGRSKITTGFMGMAWDGDVPGVEVWFECLRVLKPGGHMLSFAGTRTQHRMATRIEDAGFEIRDMVAWVYGSGFPKSLNLDGDHAGWGTALKPALEPITVARKPLTGTVAANVGAHGTGALNIDGCRVETDENLNGGAYAAQRQESQSPWAASGSLHKTTGKEFTQPTGRWPANLIHDGSDDVLAAFPQAPGQMADAKQPGERKTANVYGAMRYANGRDGEPSADSDNDGTVGFKMKPGARRLDSGSAARFFYCAKASKSDREDGNTHPTVKPTELMRYLCRLVTPPGGTVLDPFMGSGSTGKAALLERFNFIGCEMSAEYMAIAGQRLANAYLSLYD